MNSSSEKNDINLPDFNKYIESIQKINLFSSFPPQVTKVLTYLFESGIFDPGDTLCEPGEDTGQAYYILSGRITAYWQRESEKEKLREFGKGDFIGGFALFGNFPSLFYLVAEEKTQFLTLHRQQMLKVIDQFPDLKQIVLKSILKNLLQWEEHCIKNVKEASLTNMGITLL